MLANIEFYNTPDGDVIIKEVNQPARRLKRRRSRAHIPYAYNNQ